jgi:Gpi18-like mannosyltransferase
MMQGKWCFYSVSSKLNYPPLFSWILYAIQLLSNLTGVSFSTLIKLPSILADCFISILIYQSSLRSGAKEKAAMAYGFFYALNPVSVLITSVHGQVDSLIILFCFLAWFFYEFKQDKKSIYLSAICLSIAISLKGFPVVLLPLFLIKLQTKKDRLVYAALAIFPTILSFIPYLAVAPMPTLKAILGYSPRPGNWGYTLVLAILYNHLPIAFVESLQKMAKFYGNILLLVSLLLFYKYTVKKFNLLNSIVSLFALFYALTAGFGLQYLVWIVPFAILNKEFPIKLYTLFASLWLLISYSTVIFSKDYCSWVITIINALAFWKMAVISSLLTWGVCMIWTFKKLILAKQRS